GVASPRISPSKTTSMRLAKFLLFSRRKAGANNSIHNAGSRYTFRERPSPASAEKQPTMIKLVRRNRHIICQSWHKWAEYLIA
ncbi:hypothetical protein KW789_02565, partial [Candidatus Saccharibacteria bacterium]|nr:hypothetical protein [Candidatus Saccharibacteria bacterium]